MKNTIVKDQIIGSYDTVMKDYLESPEQEEAFYYFNKEYFAFRNSLDPEDCKAFDKLMTMYEELHQDECSEALYHGVMAGIVERDNAFSGRDLER